MRRHLELRPLLQRGQRTADAQATIQSLDIVAKARIGQEALEVGGADSGTSRAPRRPRCPPRIRGSGGRGDQADSRGKRKRGLAGREMLRELPGGLAQRRGPVSRGQQTAANESDRRPVVEGRHDHADARQRGVGELLPEPRTADDAPDLVVDKLSFERLPRLARQRHEIIFGQSRLDIRLPRAPASERPPRA